MTHAETIADKIKCIDLHFGLLARGKTKNGNELLDRTGALQVM
jgi:hypothetical protein